MGSWTWLTCGGSNNTVPHVNSLLREKDRLVCRCCLWAIPKPKSIQEFICKIPVNSSKQSDNIKPNV